MFGLCYEFKRLIHFNMKKKLGNEIIVVKMVIEISKVSVEFSETF